MYKLYRARIIKKDRKYINAIISECKRKNSSIFEIYDISIVNKNRYILYLSAIHYPKGVISTNIINISYVRNSRLNRYNICVQLDAQTHIPMLSLPADSEIIKKEGIYKVINLLKTLFILKGFNYISIGIEIKKIYK